MSRDLASDWRLLTSAFRVRPDFIVAGETKCGTTSLYYYLTRHADVFAADRKEPNNFIEYPRSRIFCTRHYPTVLTRLWHARVRGRTFRTGEASAEYLSHPDVAGNVAAVCPGARLVVMLRDPVRRAWSDYQMFRRAGAEALEFPDIVRRSLAWLGDEDFSALLPALARVRHHPLRYVLKGLYARSLAPWLERFDRKALLVLSSEAFFADPGRELARAQTFLGLEPQSWDDYPVRREGGYGEEPDAQSVAALRAFYRPHNEALYRLLGEDFGWEAG